MNKRIENGKMYNRITQSHMKCFDRENKLVYENKTHFVDFQNWFFTREYFHGGLTFEFKYSQVSQNDSNDDFTIYFIYEEKK
jgi:hypothetical protein